MIGLSSEDTLRLNIMLAKKPRAIRIDESRMMIFALIDSGEVKFKITSQGNDSAYLKLVRQFLSSYVLSSPGGYPVYLKRWTRMRQTRSNESLKKLLLLGEPEALTAVIYSSSLDKELATYAWWVSPNAEHARRMLECSAVTQSELAYELANFLIEFLPFETEPRNIIDSVRLVLQADLISERVKADLWHAGEKKNVYYVGFLLAIPDHLPGYHEVHLDRAFIDEQLADFRQNPFTQCLLHLLSGAGQGFLKTTALVLNKSVNQDVCICLFDAIKKYFSQLPLNANHREIEAIELECCRLIENDPILAALISRLPDHQEKLKAMLSLSMVSSTLLEGIFSLTDASGSVMRKKIKHIIDPLMQWFVALNPSVARISESRGRRIST